jgi:hypothetical protein
MMSIQLNVEKVVLAFVKGVLAFVKVVLAFVKGVLAFENGVLAFEKVVLAFEKGVLAFEKGVLAFEKGVLAFLLNRRQLRKCLYVCDLCPSYTIPDSHRSDIKFYCFEVNLALKIIMII